jgi:hypothetical protein
MRIVDTFSHLNGEEWIKVHHPEALDEIAQVVDAVDADKHRTKKSRESTMKGKRLYSPKALNQAFGRLFRKRGWDEQRHQYYVTADRTTFERISHLPLPDQKRVLQEQGEQRLILSYKQTDFVKNSIAVEVQFGKYAFVAYDLFVKHLLFYSGGLIDVGVEILPMKQMADDPEGGRRLSTGMAYFEGEVYNVLSHGRTSPPVPLLIIGIAP